MGNLFDLIRQWAKDRNLIEGSNPQAQMLKLFEEGGELAHAIARNNYDEVVDAIGDMVVVLTILAAQYDADILEDCIAPAYDTIKDRKGRMVDGVFVKEESVSVQEQAFLDLLNYGQSAVITSQDGTERIATPEEVARFTAAREAIENNWQTHDGGPMPCAGETLIHVRFRDGFETKGSYRAEVLRRHYLDGDSDIIAWKVA